MTDHDIRRRRVAGYRGTYSERGAGIEEITHTTVMRPGAGAAAGALGECHALPPYGRSVFFLFLLSSSDQEGTFLDTYGCM